MNEEKENLEQRKDELEKELVENPKNQEAEDELIDLELSTELDSEVF